MGALLDDGTALGYLGKAQLTCSWAQLKSGTSQIPDLVTLPSYCRACFK